MTRDGTTRPTIIKIVSGGQTGVDRAALDVALALGIPCGGWVPKERQAEDGRIPAHYPVEEIASSRYAVRTRRNVRDSDATLILTRGVPTGGTALTVRCAEELGRPRRIIDLSAAAADADLARAAQDWLEAEAVRILNVAGPRESTCAGIHADASTFLRSVLAG